MWRPAALVLAGLLVYANALSGPLISDDTLTLTENRQIRDLSRLGDVLRPERELPVAGRPLVNLSLALNYAVHGLDVTGYHIVNICLHVLSGLVVFFLIRYTLRLGDGSQDVAFAAALLWLVHPLNTEAVNYITQRTELMMGLSYLLTLAFASGALAGGSAAAILACAAGMACKESMATAPLMVLLYDRTFRFQSFRAAIDTRWRFYLGLAATWIVLAGVLWSGPRIHSAGFSVGVSPWTYLLNQAPVILRYLRLAAWPQGLVLNYGWPEPITVADVWPSALVVLALVAATAIALVRYPRLGFLGAWFFVTLAPTSSMVPIATEVGADRRMYLPLIAIVVLGVVAIDRAGRRAAVRWTVPVATVAAALLAIVTFDRNREYQSPLVLAQADVDRRPTSVAHHMLGVQLIEAGRHEEAIAELRRALPEAPRAHFTLGAELLNAGRVDEAIVELQTFLREQPLLLEAVDARLDLARALMTRRRYTEAIVEARQALKMNPSRAQVERAEGAIADSLFGQENYAEAATQLRRYLALQPTDVNALARLGVSLVAADRLSDALVPFRRAVELEPQNGEAQRNLANALLDSGDARGALPHARLAVQLRPGDADARDLLARAMALDRTYPR